MEFKGKYMIPATPEAVWDTLHDPEILRAALPNCEAVEKLSDTEFRARATIKIGPVKALFEGRGQLREIPPPEGALRALILKGDGQGGAAGYARGELEARLSAHAAGTLLDYDARVTIGGCLAQAGQTTIDGAAKAFADAFFENFANLLMGKAAASTAPHPSKHLPTAPFKHAAKNEEALGPQVWVAGLIGIVIMLLIVFSIVL